MHTTVQMNLKRLDYETYSDLGSVFEEGKNWLALARQLFESIFETSKPPYGVKAAKFPLAKYAFVKQVLEFSSYDTWKSLGIHKLKRRPLEDIIKKAYDDWMNYFAAMRAYNKSSSGFTGRPRKPNKYHTSYPVIQFTATDITVDSNKRTVTIRYMKGKRLEITIPPIVDADKLRSVSIYFNGTSFKALFPREREIKSLNHNPENWLAVDPGMKNIFSVATYDNEAYLFRASELKQHLATRSKLIAKKYASNGGIESKAVKKIREKYNNKITNELYLILKRFIDLVTVKQIGLVILGKSDDFKQGFRLGKRNNHKWGSLPIAKLYEYIKYTCKLLGIKVVETTEEYTSKADALADDPIPRKRTSSSQTFKGNRIKRGLYSSSIGVLINADVNGALNIAKRYFQFIKNKVLQYASYSKQQLVGLLNPVTIQ